METYFADWPDDGEPRMRRGIERHGRTRSRSLVPAGVALAFAMSLLAGVAEADAAGRGSAGVQPAQVVLAAPPTVIIGSDVDVVARTTPRASGRAARLQVRRGGTWHVVDRGSVDPRGRVELTWSHPGWGAHRLRVVLPGRSPAASAVEVVRVRADVTLSVPPLVPAGVDSLAVAQSRPARPGTRVELRRREAGRWVLVSSARQDTAGRAVLRIPGGEAGLDSLRAATTSPEPVVSPVGRTRVPPTEDDVVARNPDGSPIRWLQVYSHDLSADGRFVVVATPRWPVPDRNTGIALVDRLTRLVVPVPAPGGVLEGRVALSGDGRFLVHTRSTPRPLTTTLQQLVVLDLVTGEERVFDDYDARFGLDVSADGGQVVFEGDSPAPCAGPPWGYREDVPMEVVHLDLDTGVTRCLSVRPPGSYDNTFGPVQVSGDGSTIVVHHTWFEGRGGNLRRGVDVWRAGGAAPEVVDAGEALDPRVPVSYDGRFLVLSTMRTPDQWAAVHDVELVDLVSGDRRLLTSDEEDGGQARSISADGRMVFYYQTEGSPDHDGPRQCMNRLDLLTERTVSFGCGVQSHDFPVSADGTAMLANFYGGDERLTVITRPLGASD